MCTINILNLILTNVFSVYSKKTLTLLFWSPRIQRIRIFYRANKFLWFQTARKKSDLANQQRKPSQILHDIFFFSLRCNRREAFVVILLFFSNFTIWLSSPEMSSTYFLNMSLAKKNCLDLAPLLFRSVLWNYQDFWHIRDLSWKGWAIPEFMHIYVYVFIYTYGTCF